MIKIAIIDDEKVLADQLAEIVSDYIENESGSFIIDKFTSGVEFTNLGETMSEYKIVCLDIKMDQMDGMEVARRIREYGEDTFIIFVTSFIEFSPAGYKVGALRFILKDDSNFEETMHEALREACIRIRSMRDIQIFHFKEGDIELSAHKIVYVESKVHNVIFHVRENSLGVYSKYTMRKTLENVEEYLHQYGFIRIHKSYLVNYRFIDSMINYKAYLSNQKVFPVPRKRFRDVKREYLIYRGRD